MTGPGSNPDPAYHKQSHPFLNSARNPRGELWHRMDSSASRRHTQATCVGNATLSQIEQISLSLLKTGLPLPLAPAPASGPRALLAAPLLVTLLLVGWSVPYTYPPFLNSVYSGWSLLPFLEPSPPGPSCLSPQRAVPLAPRPHGEALILGGTSCPLPHSLLLRPHQWFSKNGSPVAPGDLLESRPSE